MIVGGDDGYPVEQIKYGAEDAFGADVFEQDDPTAGANDTFQLGECDSWIGNRTEDKRREGGVELVLPKGKLWASACIK